MHWTLVLVGSLALAQVSPYRESTMVVAVDPHHEAIRRAEQQFSAHQYADAKKTVQEEISRALHDDPAVVADSYNCLAWIVFKTPTLDAVQRKQRYGNSEEYAIQAIMADRGNDLWWRDYAAIRIRRAMDEGKLSELTSSESSYNRDRREFASMSEPGDRQRLDTEIERALLLDPSLRHDPSVRDVNKAKRQKLKHEEMTDSVLRERAETWSDWLALWRMACEFQQGEEEFEDLSRQPSGKLRAIEMSALVRLHRGDIAEARRRLLEARRASNVNGSATADDIQLLITVSDLVTMDYPSKSGSDESSPCDDAQPQPGGYSQRGNQICQDCSQLRDVDPSLALVLHASGIHDVTDARWPKSPRVRARILFFARGLRLLGADEALRGLQRVVDRRQREDITDDKFASLQNEIDDMRTELNEFRADTRAHFEETESRSSELELKLNTFSEREQRDFRENLQLVHEAQQQYARLACRISVTESHMKTLAASVVLLRRVMHEHYAEINRRLNSNQNTFDEFKRELHGDVGAILIQVRQLCAQDQKFRDFAKRHIVDLTAAMARIDSWQAGQDVRNASDALSTIAEAAIGFFVPGMEGLSWNAVDSAARRVWGDLFAP